MFYLGNPKIVTEALMLVDARFRAISSLENGPEWLYKKENGDSRMDSQ
jgi:hypothetical protein